MAPRFQVFVDVARPELGVKVTLSESDSKHAATVLRLGTGDFVTVIDKNSRRAFHAKIERSSPQVTLILAEEILKKQSTSLLRGVLFALCKGERNDFVIEKATELGAEEVILFHAERSIVRIDKADYEKKTSRWQKIAESAAKQASRDTIPTVTIYDSINSATHHLNEPRYIQDTLLLCSLSIGAVHPSTLPFPKGNVWLAIGPEGDFTEREENHLKQHGFIPVTLGSHTLRSETAAIVAMSLVYGLWPKN